MLVDCFVIVSFFPILTKIAINKAYTFTENHASYFRSVSIDFDMPCYTRCYERKGHEPL